MITYSGLDSLSTGLIISVPIVPSCLDISLEIPETHSSNSLILSFLAMRLTITVTGRERSSLFLSLLYSFGVFVFQFH